MKCLSLFLFEINQLLNIMPDSSFFIRFFRHLFPCNLSFLPENFPNIYKEKNLNGLRYLLQKKYSDVRMFNHKNFFLLSLSH